MPETRVPIDEFVCAVYELAAVDSSRGWLKAMYGAAAYEVPGHSDANTAIGRRGTAELADGRLTGRWESVVGAEHAEWLLLSAGTSGRAVLPRNAVRIEPVDEPTGLRGAGVGNVIAADAPVDREVAGALSWTAAAGAAAAVVGSAEGVWREHVDRVRARLAISHASDEVTEDAAVQVARAASDIDAAKLQVASAVTESDARTWQFAQAIARARAATDRLLASSRHALDAADPVASRWRDVHAGCRLAARLLD